VRLCVVPGVLQLFDRLDVNPVAKPAELLQLPRHLLANNPTGMGRTYQ